MNRKVLFSSCSFSIDFWYGLETYKNLSKADLFSSQSIRHLAYKQFSRIHILVLVTQNLRRWWKTVPSITVTVVVIVNRRLSTTRTSCHFFAWWLRTEINRLTFLSPMTKVQFRSMIKVVILLGIILWKSWIRINQDFWLNQVWATSTKVAKGYESLKH